ncbi:LysR family transcriptional regulator [Rhodobacterales bacterium HKCCE3408]|nr:LysR family transcriptional regulator [Rhodobacterales bacterium HKCCE3408]
METATHLKSLQALDMALREGSLKSAAERLGITPAAVGQRIRSLETYLGTDLLMRGRSGLRPTPDLERALPDLQTAFAALDRVTRELDFQRVTEIHIVAEPDWAELWLAPRLPEFQSENPNIRFNLNGEGDVPIRIGAADIHIDARDTGGEALYSDRLMPVCSHENLLRLDRHPPEAPLEGYPLCHLEHREGKGAAPEWPDWFAAYGMRSDGFDRGSRYRNYRLAIEAARVGVGMTLAPVSLCVSELAVGHLYAPYPDRTLAAAAPYRVRLRDRASDRPQVRRFLGWLKAEAAETAAEIARITAPAQPS